MDDLYKILEVSKDASLDEIKRAYKTLALKYHPDKCGDIHIDKFNKISNAYHILSDPEKRKAYDETFNNVLMSFDFQKLFCLLLNALLKQNQKKENLRNLVIEIPVELQELYKKVIKKICVKVRRFKEKECTETIPLYLSLLNYEKQYVYKDIGDEFMMNNQIVKTDIVLVLKIKEHPVIKIDNIFTQYDLYIQKDISLYQYFYGYEEDLEFFGKTIHISYDGKRTKTADSENSHPGSFCAISTKQGLGLPYYDQDSNVEKRGDLYLYFYVKLPFEINKEDHEFERFLKIYFS